MDTRGNIYRAPEDEIPGEDKARLDGYLRGRAEKIERIEAEAAAHDAAQRADGHPGVTVNEDGSPVLIETVGQKNEQIVVPQQTLTDLDDAMAAIRRSQKELIAAVQRVKSLSPNTVVLLKDDANRLSARVAFLSNLRAGCRVAHESC